MEKEGKMSKINGGIKGVSLSKRDQEDSPTKCMRNDNRLSEKKQALPIDSSLLGDRPGDVRDNESRELPLVRWTTPSSPLSSAT
jgi:hypothetical protein